MIIFRIVLTITPLNYTTERWAPLRLVCNRKGTLAITPEPMGGPCDWRRETI